MARRLHKIVKMVKQKHKNPTGKKISRREALAISRAGLPLPQERVSRKEFIKLQKQWYAKLAKEGFEDIEWIDHSTGKGHNSPFLRGSMQGGRRYHAGRDLYFRMATNYLHNCKSSSLRNYRRIIWRLHAEGATYQEIVNELSNKHGLTISIFTVFSDIQHIAKLCRKWNQTAPEGLMVKWAEDRKAIEDSVLEDFMQNEYDWLLDTNYRQE